MTEYQKKHTLEVRTAEAKRILEKYPDRVPIIVEKNPNSDVPDIDKKKYLVPHDLSVGQWQYVIRKRLKLKSEEALFLFVNKNLVPASSLIGQIYNENKNEDLFLYFTYSGENAFGQ